jgi:hypothetical protein
MEQHEAFAKKWTDHLPGRGAWADLEELQASGEKSTRGGKESGRTP